MLFLLAVCDYRFLLPPVDPMELGLLFVKVGTFSLFGVVNLGGVQHLVLQPASMALPSFFSKCGRFSVNVVSFTSFHPGWFFVTTSVGFND